MTAESEPPVHDQMPPRLSAGASRVDITPADEALPERFLGVTDPIYARCLVLDDKTTSVALVAVDVIGISTALCETIAARVEAETGIDAEHLLVFASHTHSVPGAVAEQACEAIVSAVVRAQAARRPATLRAGEGRCHINVNRTLFDTTAHRWREGRNDEGPSDKTLSVLHVEGAEGETIAVLFDYAVHGVVTGLRDEISGDVPGAASRHLEAALGGRAVALFASGCAGDQNPRHYQQTLDLRARRIAEHAARGIDIQNSMPAGGDGLDHDDPVVRRLLAEQVMVSNSLGVVLAEDVLEVLRVGTDRPRSSLTISSQQVVVHAPGRRRTDTGRAGRAGSYVDADPVPLRVGMLRLGDVVIGSVDAELFTEIGQRFRRASPARHSMIITLCNGRSPSGYVASNTAAGFLTFEVLSSRLQPGYAEALLVDTLLDLVPVDCV